jgi:uncharacterized protein (DUF1501 family)
MTRRAAVQAGAIGLLGLGMNHLAPLRAAGAAADSTRERARAVIYIFLSGGLAQQDSFDPKPDAPEEVRGEFASIPTRTPGVHICEHLPELAKRSHLWALCRSLTHKSNDHSASHHIMLTGRSDLPIGFDPNRPKQSDHPSITALANTILQPRNNLPPAIILPQKLIHRTGRVIPGQFGGVLGARRDPWILDASPFNAETYGAYPEFLFHHRTGAAKDCQLPFRSPSVSLPEDLASRVTDRLALQAELDRQRGLIEAAAEVQSFDRYWQMAASLLVDQKTASAFDVANAEPNLQARYGANSFGRSLLLAARLVEAGVRLVQVNLGNNETWDTHEAAFPNLKNFLLPPMDRAVSALLDDLQARGLLDSTLIVMAGEFGRTPRIFKIPGASLPGRDHWGAVQTVFLAGGGIHGGAVLGATDKQGGFPIEDFQTPEALSATVFDSLGLPATATWHDELGRPFNLYHGAPFRQLFA